MTEHLDTNLVAGQVCTISRTQQLGPGGGGGELPIMLPMRDLSYPTASARGGGVNCQDPPCGF